jgi:uncharacterized protein
MIQRRIQALVSERLRSTSSVVLLGPRQVGKTTLARTIADERGTGAVYLDLESAADQRRLSDPEQFLAAQHGKLVVIDEIHRAPGLFPILRGLIDARRRAGDRFGHFLLLGSASLDLMRQSSESLAGRTSYIELAGIDAGELGTQDEHATTASVDTLWVRGGFPESLLAPDDHTSLAWRRDLVRAYLEREVPMFAPRLPSATIERCWRMLAHGQGSLLNQSQLAAALGVSAPAVGRYVDLLVDLLLVRRLQPWSGNAKKRLVRSPKTYVRDSGLVHALLDLETLHDVTGHAVAGASWEGLAIETLIAAAGDRYTPTFYRTADGTEVDLVLERGGVVAMAVEIKRSSAPAPSRGLRLACEVLEPKEVFIVHGGSGEWPAGDGIIAIPLHALAVRLAAST